MTKIYMAFYKKNREITNLQTFWFRAFDTLVKVMTWGKYSHCELAIKSGDNYHCFSSSKRDNGVRRKFMPLPSDTWDLVDISHLTTTNEITEFYKQTKGTGYDVIGLLSPLIGNLHSKDKWFCSEWCGAAIGLSNPNKLSPIGLYRILAIK